MGERGETPLSFLASAEGARIYMGPAGRENLFTHLAKRLERVYNTIFNGAKGPVV